MGHEFPKSLSNSWQRPSGPFTPSEHSLPPKKPAEQCLAEKAASPYQRFQQQAFKPVAFFSRQKVQSLWHSFKVARSQYQSQLQEIQLAFEELQKAEAGIQQVLASTDFRTLEPEIRQEMLEELSSLSALTRENRLDLAGQLAELKQSELVRTQLTPLQYRVKNPASAEDVAEFFRMAAIYQVADLKSEAESVLEKITDLENQEAASLEIIQISKVLLALKREQTSEALNLLKSDALKNNADAQELAQEIQSALFKNKANQLLQIFSVLLELHAKLKGIEGDPQLQKRLSDLDEKAKLIEDKSIASFKDLVAALPVQDSELKLAKPFFETHAGHLWLQFLLSFEDISEISDLEFSQKALALAKQFGETENYSQAHLLAKLLEPFPQVGGEAGLLAWRIEQKVQSLSNITPITDLITFGIFSSSEREAFLQAFQWAAFGAGRATYGVLSNFLAGHLQRRGAVHLLALAGESSLYVGAGSVTESILSLQQNKARTWGAFAGDASIEYLTRLGLSLFYFRPSRNLLANTAIEIGRTHIFMAAEFGQEKLDSWMRPEYHHAGGTYGERFMRAAKGNLQMRRDQFLFSRADRAFGGRLYERNYQNAQNQFQDRELKRSMQRVDWARLDRENWQSRKLTPAANDPLYHNIWNSKKPAANQGPTSQNKPMQQVVGIQHWQKPELARRPVQHSNPALKWMDPKATSESEGRTPNSSFELGGVSITPYTQPNSDGEIFKPTPEPTPDFGNLKYEKNASEKVKEKLRMRAVEYILNGFSFSEVAEALGTKRDNIIYWVKKYKKAGGGKKGFEALIFKPKSPEEWNLDFGGLTFDKATPAQQAQIRIRAVEYAQQGVPHAVIAEAIGSSRTVVGKWERAFAAQENPEKGTEVLLRGNIPLQFSAQNYKAAAPEMRAQVRVEAALAMMDKKVSARQITTFLQGVSRASIERWKNIYLNEGEQALRDLEQPPAPKQWKLDFGGKLYHQASPQEQAQIRVKAVEYARQKVSFTAIAAAVGVTRNLVSKWANSPQFSLPNYSKGTAEERAQVRVEVVLAMIQQKISSRKICKVLKGVNPVTLDRWKATYLKAGSDEAGESKLRNLKDDISPITPKIQLSLLDYSQGTREARAQVRVEVVLAMIQQKISSRQICRVLKGVQPAAVDRWRAAYLEAGSGEAGEIRLRNMQDNLHPLIPQIQLSLLDYRQGTSEMRAQVRIEAVLAIIQHKVSSLQICSILKNVNRTTVDLWKAAYIEAGGGSSGERRLREMLDRPRKSTAKVLTNTEREALRAKQLKIHQDFKTFQEARLAKNLPSFLDAVSEFLKFKFTYNGKIKAQDLLKFYEKNAEEAQAICEFFSITRYEFLSLAQSSTRIENSSKSKH